jgi:hypothetical protein
MPRKVPQTTRLILIRCWFQFFSALHASIWTPVIHKVFCAVNYPWTPKQQHLHTCVEPFQNSSGGTTYKFNLPSVVCYVQDLCYFHTLYSFNSCTGSLFDLCPTCKISANFTHSTASNIAQTRFSICVP